MNAFGARLARCGVPQLDERSRGCAVLRGTLERTPWEDEVGVDLDLLDDGDEEDCKCRLKLRGVKVLDGQVPPAAVWIRICRKGLYEMKG